MHYLATGDERAKDIMNKISSWIRQTTDSNPTMIRSGYWLDGDVLPISDYWSVAFAGPFAVAGMASEDNRVWMTAMWESIAWANTNQYYEDSLQLLTLIALSGNWWAPEEAPCP